MFWAALTPPRSKIHHALHHKIHGLHLLASPTPHHPPLRRRRNLRSNPVQTRRPLQLAHALHPRPHDLRTCRLLHPPPPSQQHREPNRRLLHRRHAHLHRAVPHQPRGFRLD